MRRRNRFRGPDLSDHHAAGANLTQKEWRGRGRGELDACPKLPRRERDVYCFSRLGMRTVKRHRMPRSNHGAPLNLGGSGNNKLWLGLGPDSKPRLFERPRVRVTGWRETDSRAIGSDGSQNGCSPTTFRHETYARGTAQRILQKSKTLKLTSGSRPLKSPANTLPWRSQKTL